MTRVLVIEDDVGIRENIVELLEAEGYDSVGAADGRAGVAEALARPPDLVLCDISMPHMDGYQVLQALHEHEVTARVPIVFLSARVDRDEIRHGMNLGADDYLTKPYSRADLLASVEARLMRAQSRDSRPSAAPSLVERSNDPAPPRVVVVDEAMRELYETARRAAQGPISVMILGETGVGKDVLAREIHQASPRASGPFVALNCAALSETLLESVLFGHEKGAFTGAGPARPGLFESAEGGTVFLDEIGDIPLSTQVKLLRVLEERKVMRVGARTPIPFDVRFVSATNRDIDADVEAGTFRSDLRFRLDGLTLWVPPLRERLVEVEALCEIFLEMSSRELRRKTPQISAEALRALLDYEWPGNVRELRHAMERAALLCGDAQVEVRHLPPRIAQAQTQAPLGRARDSTPPRVPLEVSSTADLPGMSRAAVEAIEKRRIEEALSSSGGNQTQAAAKLGISRRTLVSRLSQYDFPRPRKKG